MELPLAEGFAIACASDIRYCGASAKFGTAFVRLGISGCDIGVSWMLPRLIGASRAWELMLTGRLLTRQKRIGSVSLATLRLTKSLLQHAFRSPEKFHEIARLGSG